MNLLYSNSEFFATRKASSTSGIPGATYCSTVRISLAKASFIYPSIRITPGSRPHWAGSGCKAHNCRPCLAASSCAHGKSLRCGNDVVVGILGLRVVLTCAMQPRNVHCLFYVPIDFHLTAHKNISTRHTLCVYDGSSVIPEMFWWTVRDSNPSLATEDTVSYIHNL